MYTHPISTSIYENNGTRLVNLKFDEVTKNVSLSTRKSSTTKKITPLNCEEKSKKYEHQPRETGLSMQFTLQELVWHGSSSSAHLKDPEQLRRATKYISSYILENIHSFTIHQKTSFPPKVFDIAPMQELMPKPAPKKCFFELKEKHENSY